MDTNVANRLIDALRDRGWRIVFAESCTAGLVAATLAEIPGVSEFLCGSAVTYREQTKHLWLGVEQAALDQYTAVSSHVTAAMAEHVLNKTPEATIGVAVTGHLGPDAPAELDGVVFISTAVRGSQQTQTTRITLSSTGRVPRQREAAEAVLATAVRAVAK
jgi:PncC family amidohydrolase